MKRVSAAASVAVLVPALAVAGGALPAPATAGSAPGATPVVATATTATAARPGTTVTLITGDRVILGPGGVTSGVTVVPATRPGRQVVFTATQLGRDVYVVPSDVQTLVGTVLDRTLFDVTELVAEHLDDAHSATLPLIIGRAPQGTTRRADLTTAVAGVRTVRQLDSIDAVAVTAQKSDSGLGAALASTGVPRGAGPAATRAGLAAGPLAGVDHIWLDRRVQAAGWDRNLTQIGAPTAWQQGANGAGVTVAVLDTGIDTTHPDLVGTVADEVNLTDAATADDHFGHGTFVAATIAGTGAAADHRRQGVAYGARLLNVKVLDDGGSGDMSWVIAGMQWAAQHGAKVANLSLGSYPSDGTDPVSVALDQITEQYGTLFVVAAGNDGAEPGTVDAPGTADDALTVGALDAHDQVASFSSRGPRVGDHAMKPDLSAPGVDIVGARATGTWLGDPVGTDYVTLSGTSMATPHVAGAAAVLAGAHPDWSWAQLKAALIGTATPVSANGYDAGSGDVNIAHALSQRVISASGHLDFGFVGYPQATARPVVRTTTLSNTGPSATTVRLAASLRGAPAAMVSVAPSSLTIPAGGSATVTVTVDPRLGARGLLTGALTATPTGKHGSALSVPLGMVKEVASHTITIRGTEPDGTPAAGELVNVMNATDANTYLDTLALGDDGTATTRVPDGPYAVQATFRLPSAGGDVFSQLADPQVDVHADTVVSLDARDTVPASATVSGRATQPDMLIAATDRVDATGRLGMANIIIFGGAGGAFRASQLRVQPSGGATVGTFHYIEHWRLTDPGSAVGSGTSPFLYDLAFITRSVPRDDTHALTRADTARLAHVRADYRSLEGQATYSEDRFVFGDGVNSAWSGSDGLPVPQQRDEYLTAGSVTWQQELAHYYGNVAIYLRQDQPSGYPVGSTSTLTRLAAPAYPQTRAVLDDTHLQLIVDNAADASGMIGYVEDVEYPSKTVEDLRLYRNDQLLTDQRGQLVDAAVDPSPARYRLIHDVNNSAVLPSGGIAHTEWDFTVGGTTHGAVTPPILQVDYHLGVGVDNQAAPARPLTLALDVHPLDGARASAVADTLAWYSTDGSTWHALSVRGSGAGRYAATIPASALLPGTHVSLRVRATDHGGNSIDQTLTGAVTVGS
ncbi:MAG TPA: S8 family serine peptidase [Jatrophihabitantaceae bacterium]